MTARGIETRLRKLEAARPNRDAFFLIWDREDGGAPAVMAPGSTARQRWPFDDEPPAPRWVTVEDVSDRELQALIEALRQSIGVTGTDQSVPHAGDLKYRTDNELARMAFRPA